MKALELQLPNGTPAPATDFGSVPPGTTTVSRQLLLKNVGNEVLTGLRLRVTQDGAVPGEYLVSANGLSLTDQWLVVTEDGVLAPGDSVLLTEAWTTPAGTTATGADHGRVSWQFLR